MGRFSLTAAGLNYPGAIIVTLDDDRGAIQSGYMRVGIMQCSMAALTAPLGDPSGRRLKRDNVDGGGTILAIVIRHDAAMLQCSGIECSTLHDGP